MTLTELELARMRTVMNGSMPDTCNVLHDTIADDGMGGGTVSATGTTEYACTGRPTTYRDSEVVEAYQVVGRATYWLTLPYTAEVDHRDRITWSGKTLQVLRVYDDPSRNLATRVLAVEK